MTVETRSERVEDKELVITGDTKTSGHGMAELVMESSARGEHFHDDSSEFIVNDVASDAAVICGNKDDTGTGNVHDSTNDQEVSSYTTVTDDVSVNQSGTDNMSGKQTDTYGISGEQTGTYSISGEQTSTESISDEQTGTDSISGEQTGTESISGEQTGTDSISDEQTGTDSINGEQTGTESISDERTGTDSISGEQTGTVSISGEQTGTESVSGEQTGTDSISDEQTGTYSISGEQTGTDSISGEQTRTESISGEQTRTESISGEQTGTVSISGEQTGTESVSGEQTGTDSISDEQTGTYSISGEQTGTDSISGEQTGTEHISGEQTGTDIISGEQTGTDSISGEQTRTESISGEQTRTESISGEQTRTDSISGEQTGTESISGEHTRTDSISGEQTDTDSKNTDSKDTQFKEALQLSDVSKEAEAKNIDTSNCNAEFGSQAVTDDREFADSKIVDKIGQDDGKKSAFESNGNSVARTCSEIIDTLISTDAVSKTGKDAGTQNNEEVVNEIENYDDSHIVDSETKDKCLYEDQSGKNYLSGSNTQNTSELEMKNAAEYFGERCTAVENNEIRGTLSEEERAVCTGNLEQSGIENKDKEIAVVCSESSPAETENHVDEGFMITDVRSLTDINACNTTSDNTVLGNETNQKVELHGKSVAVYDNHPQTKETDSEVLEMSQHCSDSKKKRKPPNTVKRVTNQSTLGENLVINVTEEQLPAYTAPLTPVQLSGKSGTDPEKRSETGSEVAQSCSVSASVSSTVFCATPTESGTDPEKRGETGSEVAQSCSVSASVSSTVFCATPTESVTDPEKRSETGSEVAQSCSVSASVSSAVSCATPTESGTDIENRSEPGSEVASSCSASASMSSTVSTATSTESESFGVISNTFSISDFSTAVSVIKAEPPEYEMYGVMQNKVNVSQNSHTASLTTSQPPGVNLNPENAAIHKGRIISQVKPVANSQKLVMSKVPQIIYPPGIVTSTPATLTRFSVSVAHTRSANNRVQTLPRSRISNVNSAVSVSVRSVTPKNSTAILAQNGNVTTVLSTGELVKDQSKDKAKDSLLSSRKLSTINIHSVGVARITDLIARKNPIPTYKPVPVPFQLEGNRRNQIYPCYECGDSFHIEKSLSHHLSRCSMKIYYKCEKCQKRIMFRNKCQLLNHLRSHLHIKKTQAVPIHIKSDSIEIETNFYDIVPDKPFEWFKASTSADLKILCLECSKECADLDELENHMKGDSSEQFYCTECPLYLNTKCGLKAHQKLHEMSELKLNRPLSSEQWKLLKSMSCPECGKHFWNDVGPGNLGTFINEMTLHLKNVCFHLSRLPAFKCTKCIKLFLSLDGLTNHLNTSLEHYYKCGMCPMALKSLKSLDSHYSQKHKTVDNSGEQVGLKAKIIYRCHVCDTLIDDRIFLVQHIEKHIEEFKKNPLTHYHCLQCGQMFMSKDKLKQHSIKHATIRRQYFCTFCCSDKAKPILYMTHMLKCHTATKSLQANQCNVKFCDYCGLVCQGVNMIQKHACLGMRNASVVVGDNVKKMAKDKTKTNENKEAKRARTEVAEIKFDIPSHLSSECVSCVVPFHSQSHRLGHLKDHRDIDKIFICKLCDSMNFKSYHELRSHEIACSEINKVPNVSPHNKQYSQQSKTFKSTADNTVGSYSDGVQLTPKGKTRLSKRKRDIVEYFMCDKCDAVFTRKSKQEEHIKAEHGFHPCHLCGVIHESQSSLKKHLMMDHEGKRMLFYCGICRSRKNDRAYTVRGKLEKHFRLKHRMKVIDESKIITELPGFPEPSTETSSKAEKHKLSQSTSPENPVKKLRIEGESDFKCAKCLFTCDIMSDFREHILDHKAVDTYQCFECGLCFAVLPSLKKHLFMVHKVRDFDLYMEENKIQEPVAMEDKDNELEWEPEPETQEGMEKSSEEEQSGNPLECKVCYRSFDSEKALKGHMRIHGMAFIKKSRRRAQASSPGKKSVSDVPSIIANEGGKKMGLILKIKMNRLEPNSTHSTITEGTKKFSESEPVKTDNKLSVNAKESVNNDAKDQSECSSSIEEQTDKSGNVCEGRNVSEGK